MKILLKNSFMTEKIKYEIKHNQMNLIDLSEISSHDSCDS